MTGEQQRDPMTTDAVSDREQEMVRVLSVICERHGELYDERTSIPTMPPVNPVLLHEGNVIGRCKPCEAEGHLTPHPLRYATEPTEPSAEAALARLSEEAR